MLLKLLLSFTDNDLLYTAHKSKLIRAWSCPGLEPWIDFSPMKTDHKGPIVLVCVKGSRLVSASADSVIKVWHLGFRHCSGVLRNCSGLPLCLEYAEFPDLANIVVCGTNSGAVHAWNADTNELIATGTKHFSQVSSLKPLPASKSFVSAGRDKTLIFWTWNLQPSKVIPAFEEIETIQLVSNELACKIARQAFEHDDHFILTGGEKGKLRLWNADKKLEVLPLGEKQEFALSSKGVLLRDQKVCELLVDEQGGVTILQDDLLSHCSFVGKKNKVEQFAICANQHEALELSIVGEKYLVVATMSPVIKVYNLKQDFKLLIGSGGHTDSVLAVAPMDIDRFVSCGKDHSVCLWSLTDDSVDLVGKGSGHSSFVGALATSHNYIFSASKDGILKASKTQFVVPFVLLQRSCFLGLEKARGR